jgi:hypothetical protein
MTRNSVPLQTESPEFAGREIRLQFKLFGAGVRRQSGDLGPLRALAFHPGDGWQGQCWARPMGGGLFEVTLPRPGAGSCCLFLSRPESVDGDETLPCLIFQTGQAATATTGRTRTAATCTPGRTDCST